MASGQLVIVQNTDYFNPVVNFPIIDNVAQSRVLSISWPDTVAVLTKSRVAGEKVKRGRQVVNVFFGLFVTPL